ncbi:MAG: hypothetical protein GVY26_08640 [Bacteroidetes bacterium]|jgi:hypothetical protein|nr:hypothetical protein [Bacteroidota bacterium]
MRSITARSSQSLLFIGLLFPAAVLIAGSAKIGKAQFAAGSLSAYTGTMPDTIAPDTAHGFHTQPLSAELNARRADFFSEGVTLTHVVKWRGLARELSYRELDIDLERSRLESLTDNAGKDYLQLQDTLVQERQAYLQSLARRGTYRGTSRTFRHLDLPFFRNRKALATFHTKAYALPVQASRLTAKGYITLLEHTDSLITDTLSAELREGAQQTIAGTAVRWTIGGGGSCGSGDYDLIRAETALKLERIEILNPMALPCPVQSYDNLVQVQKEDLPYQARLSVTYRHPVVHRLPFEDHFSLSMQGGPLPQATDSLLRTPPLTQLGLYMEPNRAGYRLVASFPWPDSLPAIDLESSTLRFTNERGKPVDLGAYELAFFEEGFDDYPALRLRAAELPPTGTSSLIAIIRLAYEEDVEGAEPIIRRRIALGAVEKPE